MIVGGADIDALGADVDVAAGFEQQVVLGDQTAAADGDIAFFGKQTGFTAHGQGAAADAADLVRSLPLIVKGAEGGDMVAVVDGETATLAAAGLPAAVAAASSRMSSRAYSRASPSAEICAPLASMLPSVARMLRWRPAVSELPTASALLPSCTCVLRRRRRAQSEPNRNRAAG